MNTASASPKTAARYLRAALKGGISRLIDWFNRVSELDELAVELFKTFARFEYALKATKFRTIVGDAKADWTAFANSIPTALKKHPDARVTAAVDYIEAHPPKKTGHPE